jgi:hypothetical protein
MPYPSHFLDDEIIGPIRPLSFPTRSIWLSPALPGHATSHKRRSHFEIGGRAVTSCDLAGSRATTAKAIWSPCDGTATDSRLLSGSGTPFAANCREGERRRK